MRRGMLKYLGVNYQDIRNFPVIQNTHKCTPPPHTHTVEWIHTSIKNAKIAIGVASG